MTTLAKVQITRSWTLVYDSSVSGSFTGAVCSIDRSSVAYRVANSLPGADDPGMTPGQWITVSLSQSKGDKLYAKSTESSAQILLDEGMGAEANDVELIRRFSSAFDIFNQIKTVEYTPIIENKPGTGYSFIRDKIDDPTKLNLVGGELELDGTDQLRACYTRKYGRYLPGLVAQAGIRARMLDPDVGTYRFGYGNGLGNRAGMEVIDGQYRTYVESDGVRWYSADRSEWLDPLDGSGASGLDITDLNGATLRMKFGHYGGLSILFFLAIGRRIGGDIEVLIDSSGPRADGITLERPDLPIFAETNSKLYIGGRQFGIFGRYRPQFRITSSGRVTKNNVGTTFVPAVSFRIKSDIRWQSVPVELVAAKAASTVNGQFRVVVDGTLTAGGAAIPDVSWTDVPGIDPNETAVEMNVTADAITGGYKLDSDLVTGGVGNAGAPPASDLADINLPRDTVVTLVVAADTGTNNTFRTLLKVKEEH